MKTLNLNLPYRIKQEEKRVFPESKHVSEGLLRALVQIRYPQGMNRGDTRSWGRIMDLMDEAVSDGKPPEICVEKSEFLWLSDVVNWCLDNSKVPPLMASWVNTLSEHLDEIKKQAE